MIQYKDMNIFRKLFYNFMYLTNPPWDTGITPPELVSFVESYPPGKALDLGCGTGTNAIYMAQKGWEVSGVDFVGRAIRTARRKARQAGVQVKFYLDDVTRLKGITGPFYLILDIGCFHNLQGREKITYIQNLERLLDTGGTFLIYGFIQTDLEQKDGLSKDDLEALSGFMQLEWRQDGTERGIRASAWLRYRR